jgi:hypothetical protein
MKFNTKNTAGNSMIQVQGLLCHHISNDYLHKQVRGNLLGIMNTENCKPYKSFRKCIGEFEWMKS